MNFLVRAHRRFIRVEPYLGLLISAGFFGYLAKGLKVFGHLGFAEIAFIGLGAAAALSLTVSTALVSWRYFSSNLKKPEHDVPSPPSITELPDEVRTALIDSLAVQRMLDSRLEKLEERATKSEQHFGAFEGAMMKKVHELEAHRSLDGDYVRRQVESLRNSLAAIYHRERLAELADDILAKAKELAVPTTHKTRLDQDAWERWESQHAKWKDVVGRWVELAGCYSPGIESKVLDIHPDRFREKGEAKAEQFPDPEAFIAYKGFWIVFKQWGEWQREAQRAVHQAAFNGGAATERPVALGDSLFRPESSRTGDAG